MGQFAGRPPKTQRSTKVFKLINSKHLLNQSNAKTAEQKAHVDGYHDVNERQWSEYDNQRSERSRTTDFSFARWKI